MISPWTPVFSVGPFIHYVMGVYDDCELKKIKPQIGSVLLAFLPHTLEGFDREIGKKTFIDEIIKRYRDRFDQIWLCMYFVDLVDDVCDYALSNGIHVVSAGFRFDEKFDRRLKAMFQLSDAIVCGDIGTFITYALYFGRPIARLDISQEVDGLEIQFSEKERTLLHTEDYDSFNTKFKELFDENFNCLDEQKTWMNPYGGFDQIKSKEELKYIFDISEDIWLKCDGNVRDYPSAVRKVYSSYSDKADFEKMIILKRAVGSYLD